jgi:hypothetical protein
MSKREINKSFCESFTKREKFLEPCDGTITDVFWLVEPFIFYSRCDVVDVVLNYSTEVRSIFLSLSLTTQVWFEL